MNSCGQNARDSGSGHFLGHDTDELERIVGGKRRFHQALEAVRVLGDPLIDAGALVGSRSGESYRLGDRVSVRLVEAAPVAGALRFEILSEGSFAGPRLTRASKPTRPHSPGADKRAPRERGRKRKR